MVKIAVYRDEGASALSLVQLVKALRRLAPQASVTRIDREDLIGDEWKDADLLIFPGGRDIFYHRSLTGEHVQRIKDWVHQGGRYWGICAGGYFGSSSVSLGIGHGNRVESPRQMQFFPGTAFGPSLGDVEYDYLSQKDCCVTQVRLSEVLGQNVQEKEFWAYYNTGCSFVQGDHGHDSSLKVQELGWYVDSRASNHSCAIVESFPGNGYALLCGIHPEFHSEQMRADGDVHTARVIEELKAYQKQIDDLFSCLLLRAVTATKPVSLA